MIQTSHMEDSSDQMPELTEHGPKNHKPWSFDHGLILVPTPIGNLEDMTFRAIRALKEADLILAEDTRTSGFLLKHYGISTPMKSHHKFNEHQQVSYMVQQILDEKKTIAMISDAGTPGISDPGFLLVRECVKAGVQVECLPGATALIPALVVSGFPTDQFVFEGFLPVKKGRQTRMKALAEEERTIVMYESPHRIGKTCEQLIEHLGAEREACITRELSKKFEEVIRGTLPELALRCKTKPLKGEIVLVVKGKE
ncbi:16S rRNA (cytidine(1402)-2'-O)-methyltransferase [soil metagenome]